MGRRLNQTERAIAELLDAVGESTGWALVDASAGRLKRGSVYVVLGRMGDRGLVTSRQQPRPSGQSGPLRRVYALTPAARELLRVERRIDELATELA